MAHEQEARVRAFYDHEHDEPAPGRRRRAAADWGVGEDMFDRMPTRRGARADRRAEHREELDGPRFERRPSGPARPAAEEGQAERHDERAPRDDDRAREPAYRGDWADEHERRQVAPRRSDLIGADEPRAVAAPVAPRRPRRPAESWTEGDEGSVEVEGKRPIESWLEPERGESRTIVLERAETAPESDAEPEIEAPPARRTVKITGHPDWVPARRAPRPPRTAIDRLGASPDRIVGYAVLLGFLLILIAVLTTG